jgi:outer membrane protein
MSFLLRPVLRPLVAGILLCHTGSLLHADTLAEIYESALENDAKLKAAQASYKANIETEKQARSALLPQLNASAGYEDAEGDSNTQSILGSSPPGDTDSESERYSVSLQQQVFDLPAWFSFKSGQSISDQAAAQLAADQQALIIRTAEAYFNVLRSRASHSTATGTNATTL